MTLISALASDRHPDVDHIVSMLGADSVQTESNNKDYGGTVALVGGVLVRIRVGRVTPTKVGHFVAVWRRAPRGSTEPFTSTDAAGMLIVTVRSVGHFGAFAFPRATLASRGISSVDGVGGKRGFRLYPSWSATTNAQAQRTQLWQAEFFVDLSESSAGEERLRDLVAAAS